MFIYVYSPSFPASGDEPVVNWELERKLLQGYALSCWIQGHRIIYTSQDQ